MGLRFSAGPQAGATAVHPIAVPTEPRTLSSLRSSGGRLGWGQALTAVLWGSSGVGSGPHCGPLRGHLGWCQALTGVLWGHLGWGQALTAVLWGVSGVGSGPHCGCLREVSGVGSGLHDVTSSCMCRMDCCLMSDPCLRTSRTLVPVGHSNPLGLLHWAGTWT